MYRLLFLRFLSKTLWLPAAPYMRLNVRLWLSATHEICYTYDLLANFLFHVYMRTFPVSVAIAATKEAILSAIPSRHLSSAVKLY